MDKIVEHKEKGKNPKNWKFKVRLVGYEPEENSWLLDSGQRSRCFGYLLQGTSGAAFRLKSVSWLQDDRGFCSSIVLQSVGNSGYTVTKPGFLVTKL